MRLCLNDTQKDKRADRQSNKRTSGLTDLVNNRLIECLIDLTDRQMHTRTDAQTYRRTTHTQRDARKSNQTERRPSPPLCRRQHPVLNFVMQCYVVLYVAVLLCASVRVLFSSGLPVLRSPSGFYSSVSTLSYTKLFTLPTVAHSYSPFECINPQKRRLL